MRTTLWLTLLAGFVGTAHAADEGVHPFEFRIEAGKAEEICMPLKHGQGFDFRFQSDAPVDFNVHYHVGKKVVMPIDARRVSRQTGRFVAKAAREYCLMWTAPAGQPAGVMGRWEPVAKPQ